MSVAPKRKRPLGKYALEARPKLFGGSIEEYVQVSWSFDGMPLSCLTQSSLKELLPLFQDYTVEE